MKNRQSLHIGKIFGIPIGLDYSWFLIFGLMTFSLASGYYPDRFAAWPPALYWLIGGLTTITLFASVLLHELGHALAARTFRVPVRRIRLMIFGGVAEMSDEPPSATGEFVIAIAGPVVSLLLSALFLLGTLALRLAVDPLQPVLLQSLTGLLGYLAHLNLILALFNMIPGFPLDGGRVLRAAIWAVSRDLRRATQIAGNIGRLVALGFVGFGAFQALGGNLPDGLWTLFIGAFLLRAATAEVQTQLIRDLLANRPVRQAMRPAYAPVPLPAYAEIPGQVQPDTALWTALRKMDQIQTNRLPVTENGLVMGELWRDDVFSLLRQLQFGRGIG